MTLTYDQERETLTQELQQKTNSNEELTKTKLDLTEKVDKLVKEVEENSAELQKTKQALEDSVRISNARIAELVEQCQQAKEQATQALQHIEDMKMEEQIAEKKNVRLVKDLQVTDFCCWLIIRTNLQEKENNMRRSCNKFHGMVTRLQTLQTPENHLHHQFKNLYQPTI